MILNLHSKHQKFPSLEEKTGSVSPEVSPVLQQDLVALAGVGVAAVPGRCRWWQQWWPSVQRHPDQPLLGPDLGLLPQQVRHNQENLWPVEVGHVILTCSSASTLQVRRRPGQVRGASRGLGADADAGACGGSSQVQRSERGSRPGSAEAAQHQGPVCELPGRRQRSLPAAR